MCLRSISQWQKRTLERSRKLRSRAFGRTVTPLRRLGITANHLTFLSLVFGILSLWFLFSDHLYFVIFGVIHLILDTFDGVLARATSSTRFGAYFDSSVDNGLVVLVLLKSFVVLGDWASAVAAALYGVHILFFFISRLRAPALFVRTLSFLLLFFQLFAIVPLIAGGAAVIGLVLQLNYHFTFFRSRR